MKNRMIMKTFVTLLMLLSIFLCGTIVTDAKPTGEENKLIKAINAQLTAEKEKYLPGSAKLMKSSEEIQGNYLFLLVDYKTVNDSLFKTTHKEVFVLDNENQTAVRSGEIMNSEELNSFQKSVEDEVGSTLHITGVIIIFTLAGIVLVSIIRSLRDKNVYEEGKVYYFS